MLRHLPNFITSLNLLSGAISICFSLHFDDLPSAGLFIMFAAVFDLFDGMIARAVKADGAFGKELDSLADVVSFGVAPSAIALVLMLRIEAFSWWFFIVFFNAICAALRLARFNSSSNQTHGFIGLPSPSNGLLWASIALMEGAAVANTSWKIALWVITSSLFMVANIPMIALKFEHGGWQINRRRYILIAAVIVSSTVCAIVEFENLFPQGLALMVLAGLSLYAIVSFIFNVLKTSS